MSKSDVKRTAIVTGGTRGIGADISKTLQTVGYTVAAIYAGNEDGAKKFKSETAIETFKCDVTDFDACAATVKKVAEKFGGVDILINNAGITRDGFLHKMNPDDWSAVISTNLTSCFNMCVAATPGMRERNFGRIVNISSINGQKGQMGQTNYSAAKAGMIGFTKALAQEGARKNITVNAVCPGYIKTEMTESMPPEVLQAIVKDIPIGRMGRPDEVAAMVAFLVRDEAAFITGATFAVNGGQYMA